MSNPDDKIRLNRDLTKEKWVRDIYVKWVTEIKKRMDEGSCPKCGALKWILRGSGFGKYWICDNCGLKLTRADWITKKKWWDYIKKYALDEVKRIEKARRHSTEIKTYEKDNI